MELILYTSELSKYAHINTHTIPGPHPPNLSCKSHSWPGSSCSLPSVILGLGLTLCIEAIHAIWPEGEPAGLVVLDGVEDYIQCSSDNASILWRALGWGQVR